MMFVDAFEIQINIRFACSRRIEYANDITENALIS